MEMAARRKPSMSGEPPEMPNLVATNSNSSVPIAASAVVEENGPAASDFVKKLARSVLAFLPPGTR